MTKNRFFWGLIIILAAVFIVIENMGLLGNGIGVWDIIITAIAAGCLISALWDISFPGILIPASIIVCVFKEQIGIEDMSNWLIVGAAILVSIGLSILFPKHNKSYSWKWDINKENKSFEDGTVERNNSEVVKFCTRFGAATRYIDSNDFKSADVQVKFGAMELYFDNAEIQGDSAEVNVDVAFGGMEIYVPRNWNVQSTISASLGGVDIKKNKFEVTDEKKTLYLKGKVSFGGIDVYYV